MVSNPKPSESAKNGPSRRHSRPGGSLPDRHASNRSTTGSITVEVLLSSASVNNPSEARCQPLARRLGSPLADRSQHDALASRKARESVFFSSEIHATEATHTG